MKLFIALLAFLLVAFSLPKTIQAQVEEPSWAFGDLYGADEFPMIPILDGNINFRARSAAELENHAKRRVQIVVHKSMKERGFQFLTVSVDGVFHVLAPVSTAWERMAPAKVGGPYKAFTPAGKFFPDALEAKRFSKKWQVWLKNVIRFNSGIWIHATTPDHFEELGAPASGGCTRVHPVDAKVVYGIAEKYGIGEVAITILGNDLDEIQIPWKQLNRPKPPELLQWKANLAFR